MKMSNLFLIIISLITIQCYGHNSGVYYNPKDSISFSVTYDLDIFISDKNSKDSIYSVDFIYDEEDDCCQVEFIGNYISSKFKLINTSKDIVVVKVTMPKNIELYIAFDNRGFEKVAGDINIKITIGDSYEYIRKNRFLLVTGVGVIENSETRKAKFRIGYKSLKKLKDYYPDYELEKNSK